MTWRTRLRTASFRGIRFNLTSADAGFGRRTVDHEFPNRDEPYSEDLGRKARTFQIDAFISGFDYQRQRDRLIAACEAKGPGRLVHPYYGTRMVVCKSCDVREASYDGGVARFRLEFREAGELLFPRAQRQPKSLLSIIGLNLDTSAIEQFVDKFSVAGYPAFVVASAQTKLEAIADAIEASTSFINRNSDEVADLAFAISDLRNDAADLVNLPSLLAERLSNSFSLLRSSITDNREALDAQKKLFSFGSTDKRSTLTTSTRIAENQNLDALNNLTRLLALSNAARIAPEINYSSVDEASLILKDLFDLIEAQQEIAGISDDVFQNLDQLRAELARGVPPSDQKLPYVLTKNLPETTNSLVLSYDLYESLNLEQDIIDRNKIKHPGFIPGGIEIKVLSNV